MDLLKAFAWVAVAVIAVVSWAAWQRGAVGWIGRIALLLLAVTVTAVAIALFLQGQRMRWTGEGPGILVVMIGLGMSSLLALGLWFATVKAFVRRRLSLQASEEAARATGRARPSSLIALGVVLLACAVAGGSAGFRAMRDKPAHDAPIAAVRFIDGKESAASLDVNGILKIWALKSALPKGYERSSPYSMEAKIDIPRARGARDMWVESGGRHFAVLGASGITLFGVDRSQRQSEALYTLEGATLSAPAKGGGFVVVVPEGLNWVGPASPQPARKLRWDQRVVAIDASANGLVAFADSEGRVALIGPSGGDATLLGTVPFEIQAIAFSGNGAGLLVIGAKGGALTFTLVDRSSRTPQVAYGPIVRPLQGPTALACSGQGVSCTGVDTTNGRSFAAFSGIVRSYDRLDTAPGAVLISSGKDLVVVSMPGMSYSPGSAVLKDPRF